jgi:hypothetical protein
MSPPTHKPSLQIILAIIGAVTSIAVAYVTASAQARASSKEEVAQVLSDQSQQLQHLRSSTTEIAQTLGGIAPKVETLQAQLEGSAVPPYRLWASKTSGPIVPGQSWTQIISWDQLRDEGPNRAFDPALGTWTSPRDASYVIVARLAVQGQSGAYVQAGIELNGGRVASAWSASTEGRGAVVTFAARLKRGDRIAIFGRCEEHACTLTGSAPASSLQIVQVSQM